MDIATKMLSEQRTRWLRDRTAVPRPPYSASRKEGVYMAQRDGVSSGQTGYGLNDLKSAWAAGERRILDREAAKKKARRHKWIVSTVLLR
jgi:hypothetical protein